MESVTGLSWGTLVFSVVVAMLGYSFMRLVQQRRFYKDLPKPPHDFFWGHLKLVGETYALLAPGCHFQVVITMISQKYSLPAVWYLDLWPLGPCQVIITEPDLANYITVQKNHPKHDVERSFMDPLLGKGNIVTTDGQRWKHLHKMIGPAFAIQHITNMRPMIAYEAMKFRSRLNRLAESGEEFKLENYTVHLTFDVIGKATFSRSLEAQTEGKGSPAMDHFEEMCRAYMIERSTWNVVKKLFARKKMQAAGKKLDAVVATLVKERFDVLQRVKVDASNKKDRGIMDLILRDYLEKNPSSEKKGLDSIFLADTISQVKALLVAGSGTTSDTLCFAMMLLSVHQEIVQKLREEHDRVFCPGIEATYRMLCAEPFKLNELEYTTNVIKEVLRFYPIGNTARGHDTSVPYLTYQGQQYPTMNHMLCPMQLTMHFNPDFFPNPKAFDPDRYVRGDSVRHAWRPFERGPRACLGQPLAMDELKIILLLTVRDFDFTCAGLKPHKTPRTDFWDLDLQFGDLAFQEWVMEPRPRDGMPMVVKKSGWSQ